MRLNTLRPAAGSRTPARRVGRGIGSGLGKTCGRGHKGQKSRTGGTVKPGFEGGQMPLQRRLPKYGFTSRVSQVTAEIRLSELNNLAVEVIDLAALRDGGLINSNVRRAKVFLSGSLSKPVKIKGIAMTNGAKAAVEAAGGQVVESA